MSFNWTWTLTFPGGTVLSRYPAFWRLNSGLEWIVSASPWSFRLIDLVFVFPQNDFFAAVDICILLSSSGLSVILVEASSIVPSKLWPVPIKCCLRQLSSSFITAGCLQNSSVCSSPISQIRLAGHPAGKPIISVSVDMRFVWRTVTFEGTSKNVVLYKPVCPREKTRGFTYVSSISSILRARVSANCFPKDRDGAKWDMSFFSSLWVNREASRLSS